MPLTIRAQLADGVSVDAAAARSLLALARRAAAAALADQAITDAEISVTLADDATMATLNAQWLGHEGTTDVLAFPLYEQGESPLGDVYIGAAQAARQAEALGVSLREEVARLAIHGTLHVLGMDHPAGRARESSAMWQVQERVLATLMRT
jgi:probable rRNA maturation factor